MIAGGLAVTCHGYKALRAEVLSSFVAPSGDVLPPAALKAPLCMSSLASAAIVLGSVAGPVDAKTWKGRAVGNVRPATVNVRADGVLECELVLKDLAALRAYADGARGLSVSWSSEVHGGVHKAVLIHAIGLVRTGGVGRIVER